MQPQEIPDMPIPLLTGGTTQQTGNTTNPVMADSGASAPTTQVDKAFPPVIIAQEAITQSLNTETKAILAEYTFESLGAIKIGEFSQGVSGEINISPNGITGKNVNGNTTFALNGTTGDATFMGTVEANNFVIADENGINSLNNFITATVESGTTNTTSSNTLIDLPGSTMVALTLGRTTNVLMATTVTGSGVDAFNDYAEVWINDSFSGNLFGFNIEGDTFWNGAANVFEKDGATTIVRLLALAAGSHIFKLRYRSPTGNPAYLSFFNITYVVLGS